MSRNFQSEQGGGGKRVRVEGERERKRRKKNEKDEKLCSFINSKTEKKSRRKRRRKIFFLFPDFGKQTKKQTQKYFCRIIIG